ncbi:hypothetical protein EVAR_88399_1 [Eumeta japonica]|uniref:Uncharacterized protein n=1 Tax=Eumeta variegata TaxID=151549 RepID=A0A4C1YZM7_EUMVA|nr:hypothetical protein EVAR_88399_1 [Eumeta japonica]
MSKKEQTLSFLPILLMVNQHLKWMIHTEYLQRVSLSEQNLSDFEQWHMGMRTWNPQAAVCPRHYSFQGWHGQKKGTRVRCACNVAACADCAPCMFCLTDPKPDMSLTSRVKNVNHLLNVYANTFNTDVYTRLENLTRLKLERELFPKCIQAPAKYYNKRKTEFGGIASSRRNTLGSFEKQLSYKATDILSDNRGDTSNIGDSLAHVQEWLDTNAKMTSETKQRRPLTDFNENSRSIEQQSASVCINTIPTVPQKRHLKPLDGRTYKKRPKFDEILPFAEIDVDKNTKNPQALKSNNNQNPSNCTVQPAPTDGIQFLVTAEIHAPPLIRKATYRDAGGDGGGGSEGEGSGGSTGSSNKENRDPNSGVRRGRGGGGDDDDPTSRKRRRPLRQILRSRLGFNCKQC